MSCEMKQTLSSLTCFGLWCLSQQQKRKLDNWSFSSTNIEWSGCSVVYMSTNFLKGTLAASYFPQL